MNSKEEVRSRIAQLVAERSRALYARDQRLKAFEMGRVLEGRAEFLRRKNLGDFLQENNQHLGRLEVRLAKEMKRFRAYEKEDDAHNI